MGVCVRVCARVRFGWGARGEGVRAIGREHVSHPPNLPPPPTHTCTHETLWHMRALLQCKGLFHQKSSPLNQSCVHCLPYPSRPLGRSGLAQRPPGQLPGPVPRSNARTWRGAGPGPLSGQRTAEQPDGGGGRRGARCTMCVCTEGGGRVCAVCVCVCGRWAGEGEGKGGVSAWLGLRARLCGSVWGWSVSSVWVRGWGTQGVRGMGVWTVRSRAGVEGRRFVWGGVGGAGGGAGGRV